MNVSSYFGIMFLFFLNLIVLFRQKLLGRVGLIYTFEVALQQLIFMGFEWFLGCFLIKSEKRTLFGFC